ncbi:DUF456 domain-containing protein [Priestia megaterium]|uniref:DUF456 domain-containing protein n=1 Tax=Priestia megaterium TaxID=1404 RepID=UPI001B3A60CD|nr:DUF456 domain-containing protein [Priestia megaterium]MBQ4865263.1 DUF456 domain-containing protein [Priestia megaterium]MEB2273221.1 DUF456 domain-containing protein [Bacillus sp. ILBB4]
MAILCWALIIISFVVSFVGLVYPIIPSVLFVALGFVIYGLFYDFSSYSWLFWVIQGLLVVALFLADYIANIIGVKKFGGTKAGVWGSTVGLLVGPFVIPGFGIILGPFIGAIVGELIVHRTTISNAVKIGVGSVIGFFSGAISKGFIQLVMIAYFLYAVLK